MKIAVIGAGASGVFFAANLNCGARIFEANASALKKLLLTGGGRCNFTNAKISLGSLSEYYPRGANNLRKCIFDFGPKEVVEAFEDMGVMSKEEADGRIFPASDKASDVAGALMRRARSKGASFVFNSPARSVCRVENGFEVSFSNAGAERFDAVVFAVGGAWATPLRESLIKLGHSFESPVPSLFALKADMRQFPDFKSGTSVPKAKISAKFGAKKLCADGALLFAHFGLSGPAALKFSSLAARELAACNYNCSARINFAPQLTAAEVEGRIAAARTVHAKKILKNFCPIELPSGVWLSILKKSSVPDDMTYSSLAKISARKIVQNLTEFAFDITGRAFEGGEFVTCGGLCRREVDFSTMQSRIQPGLFFLGECLDIDAITGGFNLHAAWSTAKMCANHINKKLLEIF